MTELSNSAQVTESINGLQINSSEELNDLEFLGSLDSTSGLNISIQRVTFVRDAFNVVKNYIDQGNIFEGLDYKVDVFNETSTTTIEQWLDLTDKSIVFPERGAIECKALLKEGIQQLDDRLGAITYAYLEDEGIITESDYVDVEYSVQKIFEPSEIAISALMIYIIVTALIEKAKDLGKDSATSSGIAVAGATGSIGSALFTALAIILEVAANALVVVAFIDIVRDFIGYFIQPKRTHKAMMLKTLMSKAAEQLGYGFDTDITDLDNIVLLPSNPNTDDIDSKGFISIPGTIKNGYPNAQDFGYNANEIFQGAALYFKAIYQVINGTIQFRSENSEYWVRQSTLVLPDVKDEQFTYNTDEAVANKLIAFELDPIADEYTLQEFKGTNFEVITDIKNPVNPDAKFIKGLDEIRIPWALGTRKENLTPLEEILKTLASIADDAINVFGGNSNLANQVKTKLGTLKVSSNNHQKPKLLWLENGRIPSDHREKLSARVSWEKYHIYDSFVSNDFNGQKLVYEKSIPFGYDDFLKLSENSYFRDSKGRVGQVVELKWISSQDKANVKYWIRQPYTQNLKETFIEVE